MKTHHSHWISCLLPLLAAAVSSVAQADTITLLNKATLTRPIVRLTDAGVLVDKNQMASWTNIASVLFDCAPLQAPGQRLLLRNGIGLCGMVAHTTRDGLTFRSITAGEITVAWSNVTAIRYGQSTRFPDHIEPKTGEIILISDDNERTQGALVGSTDQQILLRTADGMKKVPTEDLAWLVVYPSVYASRELVLILRNGDRLNGPVIWTNNTFSVTVNNQTLTMDQAAIRAIVNPGAAPKEKE